MGNGIAHVFAQHGFAVSLIDISRAALEKALSTVSSNLDRMINKEKITAEDKIRILENIVPYTDLIDGVKEADLVVEAATENLDLKLKIFESIDKCAPQNCLLASNTSSISITKIGAATERPEKVIGMHFMNPVPMMPLIEIIRGYTTGNKTTDSIIDLSKSLGKIPVVVHDFPGFIANRILMPMINEAIYAIHEGVAGVNEIDQVMKLGMAHPMGPLQLADFIGLDVCLSILKVLFEGFGNPKYAPCPLLIKMVDAGNMGKKSGSGFYNYQKGSKDLIIADQFKK